MRIRLALILAVLVLVLAVVIQSLYVVDMTKQALILQFGQYITTVKEPGLYMKTPFIQSVELYEKRILVSDVAPGEYLTLDKKRLEVDHVTRWKIDDPLSFYKTVRTEIGALARLEPIVLSQLRDELASHNLADIISEQREQIMDKVAAAVREEAADFGMEIVDVRIKRADLPSEVQENVFARMRAERQRIAKRYRAEGEEEAQKTRAEADREKTVILAEAYEESQTLKGEGDAEATKIYAEAFQRNPEFYAFLRSLEAYENFLSGETTLVLGTDSELFAYLEQATASE